eukprot:TRINITY_DN41441_c0_g1_i1.p1 TRINITY_DN41441_c0_g1~~TRINITY_DN41441_c0_g1_i1.p1  ORF type:complete len:1608 (+),score=358.15 TRINITY_DN41441_c0_g1_i1:155-4978(+)
MAHRGLASLNLGLSDDDEPAFSGPAAKSRGGPKREESISDLIGGGRRDAAMKFGVPTRSKGNFKFDLGGGMDPLDALKGASAGAGRPSAPGPAQDDDELEFMRRFQAELGLDMGGGDPAPPPARGASRSVSPAARIPSPGPAQSGDGSDESLADIVGDILGDDGPARPKRNQSKQQSRGVLEPDDDFGAGAASSRGRRASNLSGNGGLSEGSNAGTDDWDMDDTPSHRGGGSRQREVSGGRADLGGSDVSPRSGRRAGSRPPLGGDVSPAPSAGFAGGEPSPQLPRNRSFGGATERESSRGPMEPADFGFGESFAAGADSSFGAGGTSFSAADDLTIGRRGGRRKLAPRPSAPADDDDPLADILGGGAGGGSAASRPARSPSPSPSPGQVSEQKSAIGFGAENSILGFGGVDTSVAASSVGGFEVELTIGKKPGGRRLGGAKAKAKAFASPAASGAMTPPAETIAEPGPTTPPAGGNTPPPLPARASTPPQPSTPSAPSQTFHAAPAPEDAEEEPEPDSAGDLDLDDLLQDNTAPKAATPQSAQARQTPVAEPSPAKASNSDDELPDFLKSRGDAPRARRGAPSTRSSATTPPPATPPKAQFDLGFEDEDLAAGERSASGGLPSAQGSSGSGLLEVPFTAGSGSGRRLSQPPSAKSSAKSATPQASPAPASQASVPSAVKSVPSAAKSASASVASVPAQAKAQVPSSAGSVAPPPGSAGGAVVQTGSVASSAKDPAAALPGQQRGGPPAPANQSAAYMPQAHTTSVASARQPQVSGVGIAGVPPVPVAVPAAPQLAGSFVRGHIGQGLDPGSPLTQTVQSEGGSLHARFSVPVEAAAPPLDFGQARATHAAQAAAAALMADAGAGMRSPQSRSAFGLGGPGTPPSEKGLSLFGGEPGGMIPAPHGGISAFPPLAAAPSQDLLWKLAQSEAKVKHLELQLEDCEQRWQQRFADARKQEEAVTSRMELQSRALEAELDRCKEIHAGELRHVQESKQLFIQGSETEKENARREERRKAQIEVEKIKADYTHEIEELRRKHERSINILKQQADLEAESLRRAHSGEQQLAKLVEQVQGSVAEVDRVRQKVEADKSVEFAVRERQLEAREKAVREMEVRLSSQSKEVEEQRRRVSELLRNLEDSQLDDRNSLQVERERLQAEHSRLKELQQSVRDADRNNKEALRYAWSQVEQERRSFQDDQLRIDSELAMRKEEVELQERQVKQEAERLKSLHQQIEVARQNASRRIRETETTVANERRCLMNDLEVFEEKRRIHAQESMALEADKKTFKEEKEAFEGELRSVGLMAQEVERRSEEIRVLHDQAAEARAEIQLLRGQLQEERTAQNTELDRLKSMQQLVEQQRLQLLQTENQRFVRGIEDMDLLITAQASFPFDGEAGMQPAAMQALTGPAGGAGLLEPGHLAAALALGSGAPELQTFSRGTAEQAVQPVVHIEPFAAATNAAAPAAAEISRTKVSHGPGKIQRSLATPCRSSGGGFTGGSGRVQLQTMLRRTREQNGAMQIYIQESTAFLRQAEMSAGPCRPPESWSQGHHIIPFHVQDLGGFGGPGLLQAHASPSFGPSSATSSIEDRPSGPGGSGTPESLSDLSVHRR